jgi:hypothetical protein
LVLSSLDTQAPRTKYSHMATSLSADRSVEFIDIT